MLKEILKNSILHVKSKSYKEAVLYSGGSFTAWRRFGLHGGGSVCMVEARSAWRRLDLHGGGSVCMVEALLEDLCSQDNEKKKLSICHKLKFSIS